MISRLLRVLCLSFPLCVGGMVVTAQDSLTLRQAINQALGQNPEAAIARADNQEAKSAATMARAQLLPQLNFTEDISRGDDPVYAFGTRLRQRQFTQADFALNALNFPQPIGNFSTRSLVMDGVRLAQDTEGDPARRSFQAKRLLVRQGNGSADRVSCCRGLPAGALCAARDRCCPA